MDAPLSSPSHATQNRHPGFNNSYFANSTSSSSTSSQASSTGPNSAARQTQTQAYHHQPAASQTTQQQQQQQIPVAPSNNASQFLQDFSLVAEAAKRAQMAVLMRDLEAVDI